MNLNLYEIDYDLKTKLDIELEKLEIDNEE